MMSNFLLSWNAPSIGGQVRDYIIQYRVSDSQWQTYPDNTSISVSGIVSGLAPCEAYAFRVAAINPAGTGVYSNTVSGAVLSDPPMAPHNFTASVGNKHIKLFWDEPYSDCIISNYIIEYYKNNEPSLYLLTNGTATDYILFNLINNASYSARVAAVSIAGTGLYSPLLTGLVPLEKPPAVIEFISYVEDFNTIGLNWTAPQAVFDSYVIEYSTNHTSSWFNLATLPNKSTTYFKVNNLDLYNYYQFRIATINQVLYSDFVVTEPLFFSPPYDLLYNKTKLVLRLDDLVS